MTMGEVMQVVHNGQSLRASWNTVVFGSSQVVKQAIMRAAARSGMEMTDVEAGAIILSLKKYCGAGGAAAIGCDTFGFLWTSGGQCIGWFLDLL
jgi:hypothetical protein